MARIQDYKMTREKVFSQEVCLLAVHKVHMFMNEKKEFFRCKKADTSVLSVKKRTHISGGEKLSEGACSGREHAFYPGHYHQPQISRK